MYNHKKSLHSESTRRLSKTSARKMRQLGASLMELMVGITIGLLVVLAAIGSLVYTRVSSTTMVDATRLQQKADAAFRLINFQTLQAGSLELLPTAEPSTVVFSTAYTGFDPLSTSLPTSIVSVHGVNGDGTTTQDKLRISYQDNGTATTPSTVRDCLGQSTATLTQGISVDNEFTYVPVTGGGGDITCRGAAADPTAQSILDGVEDFQVTYGVRTVTATGVENFQYFTANNITDWTNIQTVNICIMVRGDTRGNPRPDWTTATAITPCLGSTVADTNDGYLRRVYSRTFSLRNALL
jgi:type IV pilus assembly protein PilW